MLFMASRIKAWIAWLVDAHRHERVYGQASILTKSNRRPQFPSTICLEIKDHQFGDDGHG
jgi:hypothetical protein